MDNERVNGQPAEERDDYCLVMMPHVAVMHPQPSLGLSLLHAILRRDGQRGRVVYGNLLFYQLCGLKKANDIFTMGDVMLGSWMFGHRISEKLGTPEEMDEYIAYLRETMPVYLLFEMDLIRGNLRECRRLADELLDRAAAEILSRKPRIVGCSITYTQLVPALALLRRLREEDPGIVTVLGGPNCETVMGQAIHRHYPWVDYVISGEADDIISPLFADLSRHSRHLTREQLPAGVFAPCHRDAGGYPDAKSWRASKPVLKNSPPPDYDDFFRTLSELPAVNEFLRPSLPFESSRGCWWAQKKPCAFCCVNGMSREFRSRPHEEVLNELETLRQRYRIDRFLATDSILDLRYFQNLLPALKEKGKPYHLFYQTTALLSKTQLRAMSDAGIRGGQFGIESMSTPALAAMNKNVQAWQNVQVLKGCQEFGVHPLWLFLYGFPGEEDKWYRETAELVPLLSHLPPPNGLTPVVLFRDSVFFDRAQEFGIQVEPSPVYQKVLRLPDEVLRDLAFYFGVVRPDGVSPQKNQPLLAAIHKEVNRWMQLAKKEKPALQWALDGDSLRIRDTRPIRTRDEFRLRGLEKELYLYCDEAPRQEDVLRHFENNGLERRETEAVIDGLRENKLLVPLDGRLISLATPEDSRPMADQDDNPFGTVRLKEAMHHEIARRKAGEAPSPAL